MNRHLYIAGVDEAGRGPLIGSVFAAAVILPEKYCLPDLKDSKKLSEKKRDSLTIEIKEQSIAYAIASASTEEIENLNILQASLLAMKRAIEKLSIQPHQVVIDGNQIPKDLKISAQSIIKGDCLVPAISAASILAKTARDQEMHLLDEKHPQYGFAKHKGYGTKQHLEAIVAYGILNEHRKQFRPISEYLKNQK